jgi:cholesterol transport system auxiliary component
MKPIPSLRFSCVAICVAFLATGMLSACAIRPASPSMYDLGPMHAAPSTPTPLPAISVADVQAPPWLDGQHMYYRLAYVNEQQPRAYAGSRWTMAPAALVTQRLKTRLSQAGGVVVSPADGVSLPVLRVELDDFTQTFPDEHSSEARISLRASLFRGRALLAQRNFQRQAPAPSADAAGGVAAFAAATDAAIDDVIAWLHGGITSPQPAGK